MLKLVFLIFSFNFEKNIFFLLSNTFSVIHHCLSSFICLFKIYYWVPHVGQAFFWVLREALGNKKNPQQGLHSGMCLEGEDLSMNCYEVILENKCYKTGWNHPGSNCIIHSEAQRAHNEPWRQLHCWERTLWDYSRNQPLSFPQYTKCWWTSSF